MHGGGVMHHRTSLRRIIFALTIPVAAAGGIALTAHSAAGTPSVVVRAPATDGPTAPTQDPTTGAPVTSGPTTGPTGTATGTSAPTTRTPAPTRTPPSTASQTPASPTRSATAAVPGPALVNCARHTVPTPVTVKIAQVGGRQALVDADGCALYVNTQDTAQTTACTGQCALQFPPAPGPAQAGVGVTQSNVGSFTRPDGRIQATFFGHQLYYFAEDVEPGQAKAQGFDRAFFLIDSKGNTLTN